MLKLKEDILTEDSVAGLVGQYVHVTSNYHEVAPGQVENVWVAGCVGGYEKTTFAFNLQTQEFHDPMTYLSIIMTDGRGYVLAMDCEYRTLTPEEFERLVTEQAFEQAMSDEVEGQVSAIISPDQKLLIPGVDF